MKKFLSFSALAMFAISFSAFTTFQAPMPDLCVENVEVKCASQRWLVFEVKNVGSAKSTATVIRVRPEDGDDPTQRCIQQAVKNVPILQPGQTFKLRVPLKETEGCDCKSTLKFELYVDHKNFVQEVSENNNKKCMPSKEFNPTGHSPSPKFDSPKIVFPETVSSVLFPKKQKPGEFTRLAFFIWSVLKGFWNRQYEIFLKQNENEGNEVYDDYINRYYQQLLTH